MLTNVLRIRAVQTHPRPDPPGGSDRNRSETGRPDYSGCRRRVFSPQKPTPAGRFRFLSPKTRKTRTDRRKTQIPARNPDSGEKNSRIQRKKPISRPKNPDSGDISRRSGEILTGSGEISSNPMRLPPDLAKSHRFR